MIFLKGNFRQAALTAVEFTCLIYLMACQAEFWLIMSQGPW